MAVTSAPPSAVTSAPPFEWFVDPTRPIPFRPPGISGSSVLATQAPRRRPTGGSNRMERNGTVSYTPTRARTIVVIPFSDDSYLFGSLFSVPRTDIRYRCALQRFVPFRLPFFVTSYRYTISLRPSTIRAFSAPFLAFFGPFFNIHARDARLNPREGAPRGLLTSMPGTADHATSREPPGGREPLRTRPATDHRRPPPLRGGFGFFSFPRPPKEGRDGEASPVPKAGRAWSDAFVLGVVRVWT